MFTLRNIATWVLLAGYALLTHPTFASDGPLRACVPYRANLTRIVYAEGGLNAPVPMFAAQLNAESGCNNNAMSGVGAKGMAQFMTPTALWWCDLNGLSAENCQPTNPTWAMRSLVGYDIWLYERVRGSSEFDRWWAALRAYNGGLGHWQKEAATVRPAVDRLTVDAACGHALRTANYHPRSATFCPENLGYPRRILIVLQPRYLGWGRGVSA